jgi:hypothetical protein
MNPQVSPAPLPVKIPPCWTTFIEFELIQYRVFLIAMRDKSISMVRTSGLLNEERIIK